MMDLVGQRIYRQGTIGVQAAILAHRATTNAIPSATTATTDPPTMLCNSPTYPTEPQAPLALTSRTTTNKRACAKNELNVYAAAIVTGKRCWPRDESQIRFDPATKEDRNPINTILALEVAA